MAEASASHALATSEWQSSTSKTSLVSIGTHRLCLNVLGPPRRNKEPVTIVIQGLSAPSSSWAAFCRLLSSTLRVYRYDRSGFGLSERCPSLPNSENIALQLDLLLQATDVEPPYILVAHSWGGILAREFVARRSIGDIAGIVVVEPNQERTLQVLDWRPFFLWCAAAKVDFLKVSGLEGNRKLTEQEWKFYMAEAGSEKNRVQGEKEWNEYEASFAKLGEKDQMIRNPPLLGDIALSVVKGQNAQGLQKLFDAAVAMGYGTPQERHDFATYLQSFGDKDLELQSEVTRLSTKSRLVVASNSGHEVQLTEPEVIVEEVKWVLGQYLSRGN